MASTAFLFNVCIAIILGTAKGNSFVKIQCKTQNIGQYGHQSLLNCVVNTSEVVIDPEIRAVVWAQDGVEEPLLLFDEGALKPSSSRYSFAEASWSNMNISLVIRKTAPKDEGDYKCTVYTDSGLSVGTTSLEVRAKYSEPTFQPNPENLDLNTGGTLTCKSSGYPKGQLRWFDKDNKGWAVAPVVEVEETESGLFSLSSTMTVVSGSLFSKYICKVFNARGEPEAENSYQLKDSPSNEGRQGEGSEAFTVPAKVIAPVVVIGSLIVGLLLVLILMYRRRSRQARRHSTTPLISEHRGVPVEVDEDDSPEVVMLAEP